MRLRERLGGRVMLVATGASIAFVFWYVAPGTSVTSTARAAGSTAGTPTTIVTCAAQQIPAVTDIPYDTNVEWAGTQVPGQRDLPYGSTEVGVLCLTNFSAEAVSWTCSATVDRVTGTIVISNAIQLPATPTPPPTAPPILVATIWNDLIVVVPPHRTVQVEVPWPWTGLNGQTIFPAMYGVGVSAEQLPNDAPATLVAQDFFLTLPFLPRGIREWPEQV